MAGHISTARLLGYTAPKKRRSDGAVSNTVSVLTGPAIEPKTSTNDSDVFTIMSTAVCCSG